MDRDEYVHIESIASKDFEREKKRAARRNFFLPLSVALILFGAGLSVAVLEFGIPFSPYTVSDYQAVPSEVCPGDPIEVIADRSLEEGYVVDELLVYTGFVEAREYYSGTYSIYQSTESQVEVETGSGENYPSPLVRVAPYAPGEYLIYTDYTITGEVAGFWSRTDHEIAVSNNVIVVLPLSHENCESNALSQAIEGDN